MPSASWRFPRRRWSLRVLSWKKAATVLHIGLCGICAFPTAHGLKMIEIKWKNAEYGSCILHSPRTESLGSVTGSNCLSYPVKSVQYMHPRNSQSLSQSVGIWCLCGGSDLRSAAAVETLVVDVSSSSQPPLQSSHQVYFRANPVPGLELCASPSWMIHCFAWSSEHVEAQICALMVLIGVGKSPRASMGLSTTAPPLLQSFW